MIPLFRELPIRVHRYPKHLRHLAALLVRNGIAFGRIVGRGAGAGYCQVITVAGHADHRSDRRLARSICGLLNTPTAITHRKAGFQSLDDAWPDTTTPHDRMMLTVTDSLAEFKRTLIRALTIEVRTRTKAP